MNIEIEQKMEHLSRRIANSEAFGIFVDGCIENITSKKVLQYLSVQLMVSNNVPFEEQQYDAHYALLYAAFEGGDRLAEMVRNYLIAALESGCPMRFGEVKIHDPS